MLACIWARSAHAFYQSVMLLLWGIIGVHLPAVSLELGDRHVGK